MLEGVVSHNNIFSEVNSTHLQTLSSTNQVDNAYRLQTLCHLIFIHTLKNICYFIQTAKEEIKLNHSINVII